MRPVEAILAVLLGIVFSLAACTVPTADQPTIKGTGIDATKVGTLGECDVIRMCSTDTRCVLALKCPCGGK